MMNLAKGLVSYLSTFSKDFSSEITGPISFKLHPQPPGKEGKKVYIIWSRLHCQDGCHAHL